MAGKGKGYKVSNPYKPLRYPLGVAKATAKAAEPVMIESVSRGHDHPFWMVRDLSSGRVVTHQGECTYSHFGIVLEKSTMQPVPIQTRSGRKLPVINAPLDEPEV